MKNKDFIIKTILNYFGVELFQIQAKNRLSDFVIVRKYLVYFLFHIGKLKNREIQIIINRDHATVNYYLYRNSIVKKIRENPVYDNNF